MKILLQHIIFLVCLQISLFPQEINDKYDLRKDQYDLRYEGIKSEKYINVTSDRINLLSAIVKTDSQEVNSESEIIHLRFFTDNEIAVSVSMTDDTFYYVDPVRNRWGPGFATFTWSTDIMRRHNILPNQLYVRVELIKKPDHLIFPAQLYFQKSAGAVEEYNFIVSPQRQMNLRYWILEKETDKIIVEGPQRTIGANKNLLITWDCLDNEGNQVQEGDYILKVQGTYKELLGRIRRAPPVSYQFYHKMKLIE